MPNVLHLVFRAINTALLSETLSHIIRIEIDHLRFSGKYICPSESCVKLGDLEQNEPAVKL